MGASECRGKPPNALKGKRGRERRRRSSSDMSESYCTYGRYDKCVQILVGKPERKRQLERPRSRWEDNFRRILMI
jgi:hypothetical protein